MQSDNSINTLPQGIPSQQNGEWIPTQQLNSVDGLKTPKGESLQDHFGTMKEMHFQGPQRKIRPDLNLQVNGQTPDITGYKTVSKNQSGPALDAEQFENRKNFTPKEQPCLMEMAPDQSKCYGVFYCNECTNKGCIQNSGDKTCLPIKPTNKFEPYCQDQRIFHDLINEVGSCPNFSSKKTVDQNNKQNVIKNSSIINKEDKKKNHTEILNKKNENNNQKLQNNNIKSNDIITTHENLKKEKFISDNIKSNINSTENSKDIIDNNYEKADSQNQYIDHDKNVIKNDSQYYDKQNQFNNNKSLEKSTIASNDKNNNEYIILKSEKIDKNFDKNDNNKELNSFENQLSNQLIEDGKHNRFLASNGYLIRQD